ncbi:MAG: YHYH protein, partial [Patescibacteria group bacterium]|nr:YHYH protein [Patescibacteria group bacterium]
KNPNSIKTQDVSYALPASPTFAASASCVPMGPVGIALDGVAIYNALDASGRDAVAHEVQDLCSGHPQSAGQYHYHGPSPCMPNVNKKNTVVGYALDGFPITSLYNASGSYYADTDLDACHGLTSAYTDENGNTKTGYHYVLTEEYPYTIGCFRGTPVATRPAGAPPPQTRPRL